MPCPRRPAAEKAIQLHGGIGFTWEHDCHLYLRRAVTLAAFVDRAGDAARDTARLGARGRPQPRSTCPEEAERYRADARAFVASLDGLDAAAPRPAGRVRATSCRTGRRRGAATRRPPSSSSSSRSCAGDLDVPSLGITGWTSRRSPSTAPPEQAERWVGPTLRGEITWCQLFSEPGAGSDAAAIATRGVRVDGGWRVTGQKVWTTGAQQRDWGFATVRTDPRAPSTRASR